MGRDVGVALGVMISASAVRPHTLIPPSAFEVFPKLSNAILPNSARDHPISEGA